MRHSGTRGSVVQDSSRKLNHDGREEVNASSQSRRFQKQTQELEKLVLHSCMYVFGLGGARGGGGG